MSSSRRCLLCGMLNKSITTFGFPKRPEVRERWLAYCKREEASLKKSHRLCYRHFAKNTLIDNQQNGGLLRLIQNAVPTITAIASEDEDIHGTNIGEPLPQSTNGVTNSTECKRQLTDNQFDSFISNVEIVLEEHNTILDNEITVDQDCPELIAIDDITVNDNMQEAESCVDSVCTSSDRDVCTTPKRRKYFHPRYVSEITSDGCSTLKKAKICIFMAKEKIKQLSMKLKQVRNSKRKMQKKIDSLQRLVKQLRKDN